MTSAPMVLYHASCADGFGAAWAAWKVLGNKAVYVPVQYGQPYPPEIDGGISNLYLVDFSYPVETMHRLANCANQMVVIDHHKTAEGPLDSFAAQSGDGVTVVFDLQKSGAVLTWEYFRPGERLPNLLKFVQDRDLWQWKLPESKEVSACIQSRPFEFNEWDFLCNALDDGAHLWRLIDEGKAILRYQSQQIERAVRQAELQDIRGEKVPVVNATTLQSEIGEALCREYVDAPFSATFFIRSDGKKVWSLRSRNGYDVGAFAKAQGGGGHPAAAGFVE